MECHRLGMFDSSFKTTYFIAMMLIFLFRKKLC